MTASAKVTVRILSPSLIFSRVETIRLSAEVIFSSPCLLPRGFLIDPYGTGLPLAACHIRLHKVNLLRLSLASSLHVPLLYLVERLPGRPKLFLFQSSSSSAVAVLLGTITTLGVVDVSRRMRPERCMSF